MAAIAPPSSAALLDLIRRSNILPADRLMALPDLNALSPDPTRAAAELVQRGFITKFQSAQLLLGRHKGFRLGPYVIHEMLGRGGMGAVYLAVHLELQRKVALKVLAPGKGEDQKLALERFLREARAAAALDHPNIVKIFDVARHNETPYLVMEFVDGETLQQTIDRAGAMSFEDAAEFVAQAATGLQHAHEKGFVHRDIKPANMIRDRAGVIKILDMGLARSGSDRDKLTELLDEGAVVGTADYISPEQAINCPTVDARADIYSLGATLFTLIAGQTPFQGNTTQKLMQHQLRSAPPILELNPSVPPALAAVVAKMLAKKPADRYQTAAEVAEALTQWTTSSSRVLTGLSATSHGASGSSSGVNTRTIAPARRASDSVLDTSESGKPTGVLSAEVTLRDPAPPEILAPEPKAMPVPRRQRGLVIGLGVALCVALGIAAWLAFGRSRTPKETSPEPKPDTPAPTAQVPQPKPPTVLPQPVTPPKVAPRPVTPADGTSRVAADFSQLQPFIVRSGLTVDATDPNKQTYRLISRSGPGAPPAGWSARCWNKDTEMELFSDVHEGSQALGIRNVRGPGAAMLYSPRFDTPSGVVRLKIEYAASVREGAFNVRFKSNDQRFAWDVAKPSTAAGWHAGEWLVDLKGASGGYFEFHNNDGSAGAPVRLRSVSAVEPSPTGTDRVVFKLDALDLPDFQVAKTGRNRTAGNEPNIRGVGFDAWKPETSGEWACGGAAGARAISVVNLNDPFSAQIGLELEGGAGLKLTPGQIVRIRITYRTAGTGHGSAYVQNADDFKIPDRATLPNSNTEWSTVELVTIRDDHPLRCLIDGFEKGAENALFIRSVTVAEVGASRPPTAAPAPAAPPPSRPNSALDPATWAEGSTVYALDVAAIPQFRVQKEKGERLGGEPERLPPGIGCQCWKAGAIGDFRCEKFAGAQALGVTNLNDEKSGQFYFSFEGGMKLTLQPGKAYRVKIGYQTANDTAGAASVQIVPGYKGIASAKLTNSPDKWQTASVSFIRPPAEDKVEVRMAIDNDSVGEGNTLWIRSVEVVELVPPKK
jgi:serine/threonine-protein kinase